MKRTKSKTRPTSIQDSDDSSDEDIVQQQKPAAATKEHSKNHTLFPDEDDDNDNDTDLLGQPPQSQQSDLVDTPGNTVAAIRKKPSKPW